MKCRTAISVRLAILLASVIGPSAWGANVSVSIVDFAFVPASTNINVNDTVIWTWAGNFHSSTSGANDTPDGLWDSGVFNPPHTFSRTFTSAGDFPYYCSVHLFTGDITVQAASVPPSVTLTNPVSGAVFAAPANVKIGATATVSNGSVTNVSFFGNAVLLGSAQTAPFGITASNLAAGAYALTAVATAAGLSGTSSVVNVTVVSPVAITLTAPQWTAPSTFSFSYDANAGLQYVVQRSLDLASWVLISTNTAASASVQFQDTGASASAGYYRVQRLPNP